jgi:TPM domain
MLHTVYKVGLFAVLLGLLFVPGMAWAQDHRVRHVQDEAGLFSKAAIDKANRVIDTIGERHHKDLFIETVKEGPEKDRGDWARTRFNNYKIDGIYLVFCKSPRFFQFKVGDKTMTDKYFTKSNIAELEKIIEKAPSMDEKLVQAAEYVLETMNQHPPKKAAAAPEKHPQQPVQPAQQPVGHRDHADSTLPPWVGWVCLIVGVLFVVWIIFAIIRSMTGMGGGYGYGGGYGGGGMGMGGGLLTGMLGGMFGAMAGMWLYNNMFGGHATYGPNGAVNWGGGDQGAAASGYQGDTDTGGGGGGDYGGDEGAGGGGGDDKGGDDAGGGGDWGGGGGDAGGGDWGGGGGDVGGGGGDWGGGGGGDFGGGGGDFGGGGGGGDW